MTVVTRNILYRKPVNFTTELPLERASSLRRTI